MPLTFFVASCLSRTKALSEVFGHSSGIRERVFGDAHPLVAESQVL